MKFETKRIVYALFIPALIVIILWIVFALEKGLNLDWHTLGVCPREINGLIGIFTQPLIHADLKHLFSNTIPLLTLGWCLFYFYKDLSYPVLLLVWLSSGLVTWCIGRESWHIGASGLIYGLSFFLFTSGILRRHIPLMSISLLVAFLYGGLVWNMFPISEYIDPEISWEGHLSGALSGFLCALVFMNQGPQKPEPFQEDDDEDEDMDSENIEITDESEKPDTKTKIISPED